jgi:hypothetical protein
VTESEFLRRPSADFGRRLEYAEAALDAVLSLGLPADEIERDRCRLVAERVVANGRRVVDLLARPPAVGLEARVVAEQDRILAEARDREQGEGP